MLQAKCSNLFGCSETHWKSNFYIANVILRSGQNNGIENVHRRYVSLDPHGFVWHRLSDSYDGYGNLWGKISILGWGKSRHGRLGAMWGFSLGGTYLPHLLTDLAKILHTHSSGNYLAAFANFQIFKNYFFRKFTNFEKCFKMFVLHFGNNTLLVITFFIAKIRSFVSHVLKFCFLSFSAYFFEFQKILSKAAR